MPVVIVPVVLGRTVRRVKGIRRSGRILPYALPLPGWGTIGSATVAHRRGSGNGLRSASGVLRCESIVAGWREVSAHPTWQSANRPAQRGGDRSRPHPSGRRAPSHRHRSGQRCRRSRRRQRMW